MIMLPSMMPTSVLEGTLVCQPAEHIDRANGRDRSVEVGGVGHLRKHLIRLSGECQLLCVLDKSVSIDRSLSEKDCVEVGAARGTQSDVQDVVRDFGISVLRRVNRQSETETIADGNSYTHSLAA